MTTNTDAVPSLPTDATPYAYEVHYEGGTDELVYAGWIDKYASDKVRACKRTPLYLAPVQSGEPVIPANVMAALDRMCTPLDESVLKGATAEADAHSMKLIRDYVLRTMQLAHTEHAPTDDARDATRYRWLREQHWNEADMAVVCHPKKSVKLGFDCPSGQRLDEAIDAAMSTAQPASAPKRGRLSRQDKINESRQIVAARLQHLERPLNGRCAADRDGDCSHSQCPQLRDGEPVKSGRHCPLDVQEEDL